MNRRYPTKPPSIDEGDWAEAMNVPEPEEDLGPGRCQSCGRNNDREGGECSRCDDGRPLMVEDGY